MRSKKRNARNVAAFHKAICCAVDDAIGGLVDELHPHIYCDMRGSDDIAVTLAGDDIERWTILELVRDYIRWIDDIEDKEDEWDVAKMFEADAAAFERCVALFRRAAKRYSKK